MKRLMLSMLLMYGSLSVSAQAVFSTDAGAIKGYDPVAYFLDGKPIKGGKAYSFAYNGATWHFSSEKHLRLFREDPAKYVPQYGGYCAYGVASGYKVKIEPEAWVIIDNKLYLNYDLGTQKAWNKDREGFIARANANWPKLRNQVVDED
jgi:YHS domain-containing protein